MSEPESIPDDMLSAYLDGELTPEERSKVEVALENDSELRALLADLQQLRNEIQSLPRFQLDDNFAKRIAATAKESDPNPSARKLVGDKPVGSKPTVSRPQTYQSRLRMLAGMTAAAAAIFVACWAMFPSNPNQQMSGVDFSDLTKAAPAQSSASDFVELDAADESDQSEALEEMGESAGGLGGMGGGMGGGMRDTNRFGTGNDQQTNNFEIQSRQLNEVEDAAVEPFRSADQLAESVPRFSEPRREATNTLADSASPAAASSIDRQTPGAAAAPEMLADSAVPTTLPTPTENNDGAGGRVTTPAIAATTATQLGQSKGKPSVDAVMYLANTDAFALKNKPSPNSGTGTQPNRLRFSRGRSYTYRKLDLSGQGSPNASLAVVSNASFDGISIPNGSELLVLEGTLEQVQAALQEVGATPTAVDVLSRSNPDALALTSLASVNNPPPVLEKKNNRITRSALPSGQPSQRMQAKQNQLSSGVAPSAASPNEKTQKFAVPDSEESTLKNESKLLRKSKQDTVAKDESSVVPRVRVLLVVQPE